MDVGYVYISVFFAFIMIDQLTYNCLFITRKCEPAMPVFARIRPKLVKRVNLKFNNTKNDGVGFSEHYRHQRGLRK